MHEILGDPRGFAQGRPYRHAGPGSDWCAGVVALPKHNTSTPVAAGSSVPVWPTLGIPSSVRARATTSWDVHPAGLLMTSTPSKTTPDRRSVRSSFTTVVLRLGRLGPHLIPQGHHPLHPIERGILEERQPGGGPHLQTPPQTPPHEALG